MESVRLSVIIENLLSTPRLAARIRLSCSVPPSLPPHRLLRQRSFSTPILPLILQAKPNMVGLNQVQMNTTKPFSCSPLPATRPSQNPKSISILDWKPPGLRILRAVAGASRAQIHPMKQQVQLLQHLQRHLLERVPKAATTDMSRTRRKQSRRLGSKTQSPDVDTRRSKIPLTLPVSSVQGTCETSESSSSASWCR